MTDETEHSKNNYNKKIGTQNKLAFILANNRGCESVMNGYASISIGINTVARHYRSILDTEKREGSAMEDMKTGTNTQPCMD